MSTKRKKDYQNKNLNNPFFGKKKEEVGKRSFGKIKLIFLLVSITTGIFFFFKSDYFLIKEIVVTDNDRISSSEVRGVVQNQMNKRRFLFFKQNNIFLLNKNSVESELSANPLLDNLNIKRKLPSKVEIVVTEKSKGLIWASGEKQYYLDLQGLAIRTIDASDLIIEKNDQGTDVVRPESSSGNYPLVYNLNNDEIVVGEPVTSSELVEFISGLSAEVKALTDIDISYFTVARPYFPEVTLITKDGWEVRFKISDDYAKEARILSSILNQEIRDRNSLEYIDLRFGEKVFYK